MADAKPLHNGGREHARGKGSPEDLLKLVIKATDAQLLKVEFLGLEKLRRCHIPLPYYGQVRACSFMTQHQKSDKNHCCHPTFTRSLGVLNMLRIGVTEQCHTQGTEAF